MRQGDQGFVVSGSKKGGLPVSTESRGAGKHVTVVRNVSGNAEELLHLLKKRMGCGGAVSKPGVVEIQGSRKEQVERLLVESGCLKAVSKANKDKAAPEKTKPPSSQAPPTKLDRKFAKSNKPTTPTVVDISKLSLEAVKKMSPKELKAVLKVAGLSTQGNKKELLARIVGQVNLSS